MITVVTAILCKLVGFVFLASGLSKVSDPTGTIRAARAYGILPYRAAWVLGASLPWIELAIATSLLVDIGSIYASGCAAFLFLMFVMAQANGLVRGRDISCGCFGSNSTSKITWTNVILNMLLCISCVLNLCGEHKLAIHTNTITLNIITFLSAGVLFLYYITIHYLSNAREYDRIIDRFYLDQTESLAITTSAKPDLNDH